MTFATKDEALDALELARREYIAIARSAAFALGKSGRPITVNDVRAVCPPPEGIDPRVMGAIFRKGWLNLGYGGSRRRTCHGRPVARFVLA